MLMFVVEAVKCLQKKQQQAIHNEKGPGLGRNESSKKPKIFAVKFQKHLVLFLMFCSGGTINNSPSVQCRRHQLWDLAKKG